MGVAQLVERRSVAPNVAGSIPVSHPNSLQCLSAHFYFTAKLGPKLYGKCTEN